MSIDIVKNPRVSVVITTFNRVNQLCEAIDSVLKQEFPVEEREIIVVDDGSTDSTRAVLESRYGNRIRYVYQENGGINSACQLGFELSKGEIIAQLDSDDFWYPNKLSTSVPCFDYSEDVVAVFHDLDVFEQGESKSSGSFWRSLKVTLTSTPCDALAEYLEGKPLPARTSGTLWRKSALMKIMPFPEGLWGFNDNYCARNIVFYGKVCALPASLGGYVVHTQNDYGGGRFARDLSQIERRIRESELMSDAFNQRCVAFGRVPSRRRIMIQKMALAEAHMTKHRLTSDAAALGWLARNELDLPLLARCQLFLNLVLPRRLSTFIKNRLIGRFLALD